jgi:hypothetical protein
MAPRTLDCERIAPFKNQGDASDGALGLVRVRGSEELGISAQEFSNSSIQELGL